MSNVVVVTLMLCFGGIAGWFLRSGRSDTWIDHTRGPTIEQIKELASLAVLRVPIADVQLCELHGYTGGIQAALIIKGDVEIAVDLKAAHLEAVDAEHRRAYLVLPAPAATRPRVDHDRTRIYQIDRSGLWRIMPGEAGETDLLNRALSQAQQMIAEVGSQQLLLDQARRRVEEIMAGFARALDWQLEVRWMDQRVSAPATIGAVPPG